MNKTILVTLVLSVLFVTIAFFGGEPSSARGLYYVLWLGFFAFFWKRKELFVEYVRKRGYRGFPLFYGLGLLMVLVEETFAGIAVNLLLSDTVIELLASITQYYLNNVLLLSGFIVAWYFLLKKYRYSNHEVFVLVGLFGLFSEKIYQHMLTVPVMGMALILPTMFTYIGIIAPSVVSAAAQEKTELSLPVRYTLGILVPVLVSIPFVLLHALLTNVGAVDPSVLRR